MIVAECSEGKFKLVCNRMIWGPTIVKDVYDMVKRDAYPPSEGPTDLTLFNRMKTYLPEAKILEENYPEFRDDVTY